MMWACLGYATVFFVRFYLVLVLYSELTFEATHERPSVETFGHTIVTLSAVMPGVPSVVVR